MPTVDELIRDPEIQSWSPEDKELLVRELYRRGKSLTITQLETLGIRTGGAQPQLVGPEALIASMATGGPFLGGVLGFGGKRAGQLAAERILRLSTPGLRTGRLALPAPGQTVTGRPPLPGPRIPPGPEAIERVRPGAILRGPGGRISTPVGGEIRQVHPRIAPPGAAKTVQQQELERTFRPPPLPTAGKPKAVGEVAEPMQPSGEFIRLRGELQRERAAVKARLKQEKIRPTKARVAMEVSKQTPEKVALDEIMSGVESQAGQITTEQALGTAAALTGGAFLGSQVAQLGQDEGPRLGRELFQAQTGRFPVDLPIGP